ncbi:hypothetical protein CEP53_003745 [Fusarium sp. AF-6]|nr:hypothetical protein CEP53_003745 [Fusarium sp. AF-6]
MELRLYIPVHPSQDCSFLIRKPPFYKSLDYCYSDQTTQTLITTSSKPHSGFATTSSLTLHNHHHLSLLSMKTEERQYVVRMVRVIHYLFLAAVTTTVSSAPTPTPTPESTLKRIGRSTADGPDRDARLILQEKTFAEMEMKEAEEAYKLAKALYKQRMDAAENDGQIQFTQFSEVS